MPPRAKITSEMIIESAFEIAKEKGMKNINARTVSNKLGCSTQPVMYYFKTIDEMKKAVYEKIYNTYKEYIKNCINKENPYKEMGIAFIKFAKDYPEFFKILFMKETTLNAENFMLEDAMSDEILKAGQSFTGLSSEEQKKFHLRVWIFTHGLSCLIATKTIQISDKEIEELLLSTVWNISLGFGKEKEQ